MNLSQIREVLESFAPLSWQESYDNSGLQLGLFNNDGQADSSTPVRGVLLCLDITEAVVEDAIEKGCNLIVAHHPLIFKPLKRLAGASYQERCLVKALQHGIALYAAHTNLDNAPGGVSWEMARLLGLQNLRPLLPLEEAPAAAGCEGAAACLNMGTLAGCGVVGELPEAVATQDFMLRLKDVFQPEALHYSATGKSQVKRIALCGGSGGSFIAEALAAGADCYVTGEIHYHDFFEAGDCVLAALGHYESEICALDVLHRLLVEKFPALPVFKTAVNTNPLKGLASL